MRRSLALALLAAAALSTVAATPAADQGDELPMICVRYRDTDVPGTTVTIPTPLPGDRFCVDIRLPDVDA